MKIYCIKDENELNEFGEHDCPNYIVRQNFHCCKKQGKDCDDKKCPWRNS